ncbi:MAG: alpha-glucosidase, partial [Clostridiaceae bacterium]
MELTKVENGFVLNYKGKKIIEHKKDNPFLLIGKGEGSFSMYRGNFKIKSKILKKEKPIDFKIKEVAKGYEVEFIFSTFGNVKVLIKEEERLNIEFIQQPKDVNRVYINIPSCKNEHVYGLGEQFSYLDLKGKNYPIWVREQGVGRNKKDPIKIVADLVDKAGGDYHTTFYPEPTFVSSSKYFCHVDDSSYMDFDFSKDNYHTIEIWSFPKQIVFGGEDNFINLLENLTDLLGRQSELPDWTYDGAIIGVQGGTDIALEKLKKCQDKGVLVNGIWAQDWEGKRITPFGKRLMWDFRWNKEMYPEL